MRAIVCPKLGTPADLVIEERPEPEPGPGEVAVRLKAWGLQYVDVLMIAGLYQHKPDPPFVPGLEAAGEVVAVGAGVESPRPGDWVMTRHRPGALAEVVVVPAAEAAPVPPGVDLAVAGGFRSNYGTAYHALVQAGRLDEGETLLVHGASGGIGVAAVQIGKILGATVIATGGSDEKLAVVKDLGADHVINLDGGFKDRVKELTSGRGADVIYDSVGGDVFDESMRCLADGARVLILGFMGGRPAQARTNHLLIKRASAIGVRAGEFARRHPEEGRRNAEILLDWVVNGRIRPHISHRLPFDQVREGLQLLVDRKVVGKVMLVA